MSTEDLVFFLAIVSLVLALLVGWAVDARKRRESIAKGHQSAVEAFAKKILVNPKLKDKEVLYQLKPLADIGESYPPAKEAHAQLFARIRIARTVVDHLDELMLSLGSPMDEDLNSENLAILNAFIYKHINFVGTTFSVRGVQSIVWEYFIETLRQHPDYKPDGGADVSLGNYEIKNFSVDQSDDDLLNVEVVNKKTGEVSDLSVENPISSIEFSGFDALSDPEITNDTDHDVYLDYIRETDFWDEEISNIDFWRRRIELELEFDYPNSIGNVGRRTVKATLYGNTFNNTVLLKGHCLLRDATRHFDVKKISNCIDRHSNQAIMDVREYLDQVYNSSIHRTLDMLRDEKNDLVTGLLYLGRIGGSLTKNKRVAIGKTLLWYCDDQRLKEYNLQHFFATFFETSSTSGFQRLIGRIKRSQDDRLKEAMVMGAMGLRASVKKVKASEEEAAAYVLERLD
ncbi:hypothetical protein N9Y74_02060 [Alphaproteobacteria bacterium]|nr:hypothetical protein [Alphaproteobacteria bacterium]